MLERFVRIRSRFNEQKIVNLYLCVCECVSYLYGMKYHRLSQVIIKHIALDKGTAPFFGFLHISRSEMMNSSKQNEAIMKWRKKSGDIENYTIGIVINTIIPEFLNLASCFRNVRIDVISHTLTNMIIM